MDQAQIEMIGTLRDLTLQIMLIAAGVFGIVGGFVASAEKSFTSRCWLLASLLLFAVSALAGYIVHGFMIALLDDNRFDPFNDKLVMAGIVQIGSFVIGGLLFIAFIANNVRERRDRP